MAPDQQVFVWQDSGARWNYALLHSRCLDDRSVTSLHNHMSQAGPHHPQHNVFCSLSNCDECPHMTITSDDPTHTLTYMRIRNT